jgi:hypothetical protein
MGEHQDLTRDVSAILIRCSEPPPLSKESTSDRSQRSHALKYKHYDVGTYANCYDLLDCFVCCAYDATERCGGYFRMSVYQLNGPQFSPKPQQSACTYNGVARAPVTQVVTTDATGGTTEYTSTGPTYYGMQTKAAPKNVARGTLLIFTLRPQVPSPPAPLSFRSQPPTLLAQPQ